MKAFAGVLEKEGLMEGGPMEKISFGVQKEFCEECSLALRRFVGGMEGVESIDVESGRIAVVYDERKITEKNLAKITKDSIEKLGYKLEE